LSDDEKGAEVIRRNWFRELIGGELSTELLKNWLGVSEDGDAQLVPIGYGYAQNFDGEFH
jgi:hypothetical protein